MAHLRRHRLAQSGLLTPFASAEECARSLAGIQAQITQAAALAIANRVRAFSFAEYQRLLYRERSLVRTWGQRNTVHVYEATDWGNIVNLMRVRYSWAHAGFLKDGGTERQFESLLKKLIAFLSSGGRHSREEIASHVGVHLSSWGGFMIDAAYRGFLCDCGDNQFAHGGAWNSSASEAARSVPEARTRLVRRYLHTYGPATHADIAKWIGDKAGDVKDALSCLDTVPVRCCGKPLQLLREDLGALESVAKGNDDLPIILLYRFDPLLLAYKDKDWIVPMQHFDKVWVAAGHINGVILVDGCAKGVWKYVRKGTRFHIEAEPFSGRGLGAKLRKVVARHEKFLADFFNGDSRD